MSRTLQARLDADISGENITVTGLRETLRALNQAGVDAGDMKELMHEIGELVATSARGRVPVKSGQLRNTIRAGRGMTKAVVRAGGARAVYAGVIHYGWPRHGITATPFVMDALAAERSAVFHTFEEGVNKILQKNNLK